MKKLFFLLATILIISCKSKHGVNLEIKPPFKDVKVRESIISIDPSVKQIAKFDNGVSVDIPEYAFADKNGNIIKEKVILSLKNFHTPAEIIASGIPMEYNNGESSGTFESAGMFQISGRTKDSEVFIQEGKELTITYPSDVYGDYDFFYFDKTRDDSIVSGSWERISGPVNQEVPSDKVLDTFQLKFASENYPELKQLSTISWKLATKYQNPKDVKNKWVLNKQWATLEISEPKYGFGEILFADSVNYYKQYIMHDAVILSRDSTTIFTKYNNKVKLWNRNGSLRKEIACKMGAYDPIQLLNDKYFSIEQEEGEGIYTYNGIKTGVLPPCRSLQIAKTKDIVVYNKIGTDPTVYISDLTGKLIKSIELKEDKNTSWEQGIYENFILTPNDELITNSLDGITFYDLTGHMVKQRKGLYKDIEYLKENTLIIEDSDNRLIVWDYNKNTEVKSNKGEFNLKYKELKSGWYSPRYLGIPNTTCLVINEAKAETSKIWNYKLNKISNLNFWIYNIPEFLPSNFVEGYDKSKTYHLYNIADGKDVIQIPNFPQFFDDFASFYIQVSDDKNRILLYTGAYVRYYNLDGKLIRDFKQYDSLICACGFINNDLLFTISVNGIYRTWNKKGEEISDKKLKNEEFTNVFQYKDKIIARNTILENVQLFNLNGDLTFSIGKAGIEAFLDSNLILLYDATKPVMLRKLFNLAPRVYQLIVGTAEDEFVTYVYLDDNDLQKINRYYTFKARKMKEEKERRAAENNVIRRFSIKQFGIYNWDKLMKTDNSIEFAAGFDFNMSGDYNNITVFMIANINGPAVIKYNKDQWSRFVINPDFPCKLMAILPGNKVAIFSENDFKALDIDKIKRDKTFRFKMTTMDTPVNSLPDLENVLSL